MVEERILKILKEHCEEVLSYEGNRMMEDDIIDSFTVIAIVSDLENEFDIEIEAEYVTAKNFRNKAAIIGLVQQILSESEN